VRYASNRSGGIDGGMSTGEPLVVRAAMKPIATLMRPLRSVDLTTNEATSAHVERSDTCAVPAAAVIGESLLALVLADALLEKFGGDSLAEIVPRVREWQYAVSRR
jgi:chorismate synthase